MTSVLNIRYMLIGREQSHHHRILELILLNKVEENRSANISKIGKIPFKKIRRAK